MSGRDTQGPVEAIEQDAARARPWELQAIGERAREHDAADARREAVIAQLVGAAEPFAVGSRCERLSTGGTRTCRDFVHEQDCRVCDLEAALAAVRREREPNDAASLARGLADRREGRVVSWPVVKEEFGLTEPTPDGVLLTGAEYRRYQAMLAAYDAMRVALERIAFDADVVYLGCADLPHCSGGDAHTDGCPVFIARAALALADAAEAQ